MYKVQILSYTINGINHNYFYYYLLCDEFNYTII